MPIQHMQRKNLVLCLCMPAGVTNVLLMMKLLARQRCKELQVVGSTGCKNLKFVDSPKKKAEKGIDSQNKRPFRKVGFLFHIVVM